MRSPCRRGGRLAPALLAVVVCFGVASPAVGQTSATSGRWTRVHVGNPAVAQALRDSLEQAWSRLEDPACRAVFASPALRDRDGRPLTEKLAALGMSERDYLDVVVFFDGRGADRCQQGALAFTAAGSRVVYVCGPPLLRAWIARPQYVQAAVIHEALHTLGLGEDPPSSAAITRTVLDHCYP
jgi:hypothetical protein